MFERFTDRARKVMVLATQEAQRLNHEYIGTESVLLGLIKEGGGIGVKTLEGLDIEVRKIPAEVEKLIQKGPDVAIEGKLPQTPRTKLIIEYAIEAARELNHNYVGTEHLLLGILREHDGVAAQVLMNLGVKLEEAKDKIREILGMDDNKISQALADPSEPRISVDETIRMADQLTSGMSARKKSVMLTAQLCDSDQRVRTAEKELQEAEEALERKRGILSDVEDERLRLRNELLESLTQEATEESD